MGAQHTLRRADFAPVAWSPRALSPIAWFKADAIQGISNGDGISSWTDSSGNARDIAQATGSKQPTYETGVLNGLPSVRFDGVDDVLSASGLWSGASDYTLAVVIDPASASAAYRFWFDSETPRLAMAATTGPGGVGYYNGSWAIGGTSLTGAQVLTYDLKSPSSGVIARNGSPIISGQGYIPATLDNHHSLGGSYDGGANFFGGDIFEAVICAGLTSGQQTQLRAYFYAKYGLTGV